MGFTFPFGPWMYRAWDQIAQQTAYPVPLEPREAERVAAAFLRGRAHWSRAWSLAVLTGMARQGKLPSWPPVDSTRETFSKGRLN
jgi:hypothetical protein